MPGITLVGLGPGDPAALSPAAREALARGPVFLRTHQHPVVQEQPALARMPAFVQRLTDDDSLTAALDRWVEHLITTASPHQVVYAVPGNPLVGDATVEALLRAAADADIPVTAIAAPGLLDAVAPALAPSALAAGVQVVDGLDLALAAERAPFAGGAAALSPLRPLLLVHPSPSPVLAMAHRTLARLYLPSAPVRVLAHSPEGVVARDETPLADLPALDSGETDTFAVYVAPVSPLEDGRHAAALQRIVARLRAPGGCPWDREQTHRSLMRSGIEEAYEVLEAIEQGDPAALREELGDLLLQVYLHAQIAEEAGEFTLEDVVGDLTAKLVRRHPHVFAEAHADTASDVVGHWDRIKRAEREARGVDTDEHPLGQIPTSLPALMRARTVLRRAQRAGLLPLDPTALHARLRAIAGGEEPVTGAAVADALLALTLLATEAGLDPEQLLRERTREIEAEVGRLSSGARDDL